MSIIPQDTTTENSFHFTVDTFFKKFKVGSILKNCNAYKVRGIPCTQVFKFLLTLVFTGKNLFMNYESDNCTIPFKKDVVYRMLNSLYINWQKLLYLLSAAVINHHISSLTDDTRADAFVIDDSFFSRARSKSVELLSWVNDHADGNRSKKGFRMLTLGWTDGNTLIPVSFNLLSSSKPKSLINAANTAIDKRSTGFKRKENALKTSPDSTILMLKEALRIGIKAKYVLFDSWFAFPSTIIKIFDTGLHTIAMLKDTPKIYYTFNVKVVNLPGHTAGLAGLQFESCESRVVVASDAVMTKDFFMAGKVILTVWIPNYRKKQLR